MIKITNRKVYWRNSEIFFNDVYQKNYKFICKYSIFWQTIYHLLLPPLALIIAFIQWGMLARRTSIISKDTSLDALQMVLTYSSLFCGSSSFWIVSFTIFYRFSMGFMSGEFAGHKSFLMPCACFQSLDSLLQCTGGKSSVSISVLGWSWRKNKPLT